MRTEFSGSDTEKIYKSVVAKNPDEPENYLAIRAQIMFDAYVEESEFKPPWTGEEKEEFLRRVETASGELRDWFARKIKVKE